MSTTFFNNKARAAAAAAATTNGSSSKDKPKEASRAQPWVEKYRPKTLDDVAAQDHTVNVLQRTLQASNLPHMLFYGPPGTGKTSTILALAKQLYGPVMFSSRVLELNASDERGIAIVRVKVKDFARQQLTNPPGGDYTSKYPCPPYKIIVLDEADSMTQDAQSALRRTMETYSRITRFCLVCNYVTRIIDPLASRCSKFRFKSLDSARAEERLSSIAAAEGVQLEDGATQALVRCAEGDLRKAITFLQSAARLAGAAKEAANGKGDEAMDIDQPDTKVTARSVEEIAGTIPKDIIDGLWDAMQPRPGGASVYPAVAKRIEVLVADGWSGGQAVNQLFTKALYDDAAPGNTNAAKCKAARVFAEVDARLNDGADEHLALLDLALRVGGILATHNA